MYNLYCNPTLEAIKKILKNKDFGIYGHSDRLFHLSWVFGKELGLKNRQQHKLKLLAKFHDIGKVLISDSILFKRGGLSQYEWEEMKLHCAIGGRIAYSIYELFGIWHNIRAHHERWDGKGYPDGLSGRKIPFICRILSVVDAYDAMTNDRPYRAALSHSEAIEELLANSGKQFDPYVVKAAVKLEDRIQDFQATSGVNSDTQE